MRKRLFLVLTALAVGTLFFPAKVSAEVIRVY